ncbi:hypothetical protein [Dipodfec virus UOA04_Rod_707]|nr:hypothetical protein [Dipodfec virus UOA04_Rod_707]
MEKFLEYLPEIVCCALCLVHLIISFFSHRKITKFCDKCFQPIEENQPHTCLDINLIKQLIEQLEEQVKWQNK